MCGRNGVTEKNLYLNHGVQQKSADLNLKEE